MILGITVTVGYAVIRMKALILPSSTNNPAHALFLAYVRIFFDSAKLLGRSFLEEYQKGSAQRLIGRTISYSQGCTVASI
tara:strand:+ start:81 stop:320 length:240 start_codon:yes stop_codon:yes gene_type:complete